MKALTTSWRMSYYVYVCLVVLYWVNVYEATPTNHQHGFRKQLERKIEILKLRNKILNTLQRDLRFNPRGSNNYQNSRNVIPEPTVSPKAENKDNTENEEKLTQITTESDLISYSQTPKGMI